jgi:hypothetical protein
LSRNKIIYGVQAFILFGKFVITVEFTPFFPGKNSITKTN